MNKTYIFTVQEKVKGKIKDYLISNVGIGYNATPTLSVVGDGSGASVTAVVSNNNIVDVNILSQGSNYTYANVIITPAAGSPGNGATIIPFIDITGNLISVTTNPKDNSESSGYKLAKNLLNEHFDNNIHTINVISQDRI